MRGKIVLSLFVLTLVAMFAAFKYRRTLDIQEAGMAPHAPPTGYSAAETIQREVAAQSPDEPARAAGANPPQTSAPPDAPFREWVRDEAKSLDSLSVDGDKKQAEIKAIAKRITPAQAHELRQTVLQPSRAAREKILSAYLLVEGGLNTREELRQAISAPLKERGGEPHSQGELDGIREKSLRIMLIDGLFAQAQNDPQARETLARTIVDSEDPYIKKYAQEKYDQLPKL